MSTFPDGISFRFPWRDYQARVLGELEGHLDDRRLHVVAAPGSGKTVLGLEVMRRLDRPTLILAPTLTIRDQWIDRFVGLFLPEGAGRPDWIATDIRDPRLMTVATYQALHRAYVGGEKGVGDCDVKVPDPFFLFPGVAEEEEESAQPTDENDNETGESGDSIGRLSPGSRRASGMLSPDFPEGRRLVEHLKSAGIATVIVDEAHHLRSEWWKVLIRVVNDLGTPTVVALTATPPYDVPPAEWERYQDLCGPIDAEIPVPELVERGHLCPHQDYVLLTAPSAEEQALIDTFKREVEAFAEELRGNGTFIRALESDPCVWNPDANLQAILDEPAYFSSVAVFLAACEREPARRLVEIIGLDRRRLPRLDLEWIEVLLTGCLYRHAERYESHAEVLADVKRTLSRIGAIERRRVTLKSTKQIGRLLASSQGKLDLIRDIVGLESRVFGDGLRMVILTDFIRRSELPRREGDERPITKIGVVPIFELIRRAPPAGVRLGVLCGSLVILPRSAEAALQRLAAAEGIETGRLRLRPLVCDPAFVEVDAEGGTSRSLVRLVTRLFSEGEVTCLVGTTALLGEGWDAPSVNTLILASFVGSYMLSKQMRGRAMRCQPGNPEKTANIWHLACVDPKSREPGDDLDTMARRFKAFVGVAFDEPVIENGFRRLGLGDPPFDRARIERINDRMRRAAADRAGLRGAWQTALEAGGGVYRMVEEVQAPAPFVPRDFLFGKTIRALLYQALFWGAFAASHLEVRGRNLRDLLVGLGVLCVVAALAALPLLIKAVWLILRHGPVATSLKQIGEALVRSLAHVGAIRTDPRALRVRVENLEGGAVSCSLDGARAYERLAFLNALQEILEVIENPRYLLIRKSALGLIRRRDYHAVPQALGRNREGAEHFERMWRKHVGPAEVAYTRNVEGRQLLLHARARSLSAAFQRRSERVRRWT